MSTADEFRHRTTLQVRFRDVDTFNHVNNAVFFTYVEQARITYLHDVVDAERSFDRLPLILARVEMDFRSPIEFGEEVIVETRVDRIGRTSFAMSHRVTAGDERLVGEAKSVLVTYDYERSEPIPVPDEWRTRMSSHEGRSLGEPAAASSSAAASAAA